MSVSRILIGLGAFVVVAGGAVYAFQPIRIGGVTLSFHWAAPSEALIERLGMPEGAVVIAKTEVDGPDGTMPEMAQKTIQTALDAEQIRAFYLKQCAEEGLSPPDVDTAKMEPDTLCVGRIDGRRTDVLLTPKCTNDGCRVSIDARILF